MEEAVAIIVAAGASHRMGSDKLFLPLAGKPLLAHTLAAFETCAQISRIVVVVADHNRARVEELAANFPKVGPVVPGGEHRRDSVAAGLRAVPESAELIAIHDAARPLVEPGDLLRALEAAAAFGAAALARPVTDTLKRASSDADGDLPVVSSSVDRDCLYAMETPQAFQRRFIFEAYDTVLQAGDIVTDEVTALQAHGHPVRLVMASRPNPKVTFPGDLYLVEALVAANARR
ncbi:2-C-methyl-D-erythritol 4-phosphate cytidylyltransferase [soil metagenome]